MQIFPIYFLPISLIFYTLLAFFFYIDSGHRATADCEMYYSALSYNDQMFNQNVKKADARLDSLLIHRRTSSKVCTICRSTFCKPNRMSLLIDDQFSTFCRTNESIRSHKAYATLVHSRRFVLCY